MSADGLSLPTRADAFVMSSLHRSRIKGYVQLPSHDLQIRLNRWHLTVIKEFTPSNSVFVAVTTHGGRKSVDALFFPFSFFAFPDIMAKSSDVIRIAG